MICLEFVLIELLTVLSGMGRGWGGLEIPDVAALVRATHGRRTLCYHGQDEGEEEMVVEMEVVVWWW